MNIQHIGQSAIHLEDVTPSNSENFTKPCRALYVGTAGDVAVVAAQDSTAVVMHNVAAGTRLDIAALRVNATGTTASDIVAWW